mmetsp:Transcript_39481/g.63631  ORF Transcript_39481/g.63631 Transcript_39481/m.63631 type:complete len:80 (+) Transcript_39481:159-398(+)
MDCTAVFDLLHTCRVTRTCQATVLPREAIDAGMYVCTMDSESSNFAAKCAANCVHATAQFEESMHFPSTICVHGACVCV